jgi:hypothetical protein
MLVDDLIRSLDPGLRDITHAMHVCGATIHEVGSGRSAITALQLHSWSVIVPRI